MERKIFLLIFIVYILGFSLHVSILKQTVYGDGIFYYSWLRSVVVDHDINFTNEYEYFHTSQPVTPLSVSGNKYSIGPAILWSPWFLWTYAIVKGTGFEFPYQFIIGLSSVFYAFTGLVLLYILLQKYFGKLVGLATVVAIAGATNLLFYGSLDTVNSHAVSFFASVVFCTFLFRKQRNWWLIGASLGLVALVRTQDVILGLIALPYVSKKNILPFFTGTLLLFIPQLVAWQLLYGKFWMSPYISNTEGFRFLQPHVLGVLFSPQNGLFLWTPIVLTGSIGLFITHKRLPMRYMILTVCLCIYIVASWSIWWQGASFSGRMFVGMLPVIGIGVANVLSKFQTHYFRLPILIYATTIPLCIINVLLIVFFLLKLP